MKCWVSATISLGIFAGIQPAVSDAQPVAAPRNIADEVRGVFATKCAGCHGPDLAKPKGRFGYTAAGNGVSSPQLLMAHRWLGTTAALWLVITAICAERDARQGKRSRSVRLLLAAVILVTVITAHLGGLLDHGEDFFNY
jgi:disulfide bond formation protein DsbB